ncbi:response regulator transcription factor [Aquirufa sp. ROCK-SH2]
MHEHPKILLIEDDQMISKNLSDFLLNESYQVEQVFDGEHALESFQNRHFDLVILDINLPDMSGFQVCKSIRKENQNTPILILTAYDELEDKMEGFNVGADDYLTKPFFMKEVSARIKSLLKRVKKQEPNQDIIRIEDLLIDLSKNIVKRANIDITLTPREFNLLLMLVNARGKIVTKKELNKFIWGGSLDDNNNTIEVYINFLRKKIDKPFVKQLIKTKIGFGYYLDIL